MSQSGFERPSSGDGSLSVHAVAGAGGYGGDAGDGGEGGLVSLGAINSNAAGHNDLRIQVEAGHGGGAYNGNGANGRDVVLNNAITTPSSASFSGQQIAHAGSGGYSYYGVAGNGGNAESLWNVTGSFDSGLNLSTEAYGGSAGWTSGGTAGSGGDAIATVMSENTGTGASASHARAEALNWYSVGSRGNGTAFASAISLADSNAASVALGQSALATSIAQGTSGYSSASAHGSRWNSEFNVSTIAGASVGSTSKTEAWSSADGILIDSAQGFDKQAFAYMSSNGLESDYHNFVAGNSNTTAAFQNAEWLGAGVMGGRFPGDGVDGVDHTGSISTTFNFYGWDGRHDGKYLMLSLLDGQASGFSGANDSWSLSVHSGGSAYSNTWDSSMLSFTDLFNDNVVDLGVYDIWDIGYGSSVDVTFQWTTSDATTSFSGKFAAGFSAVPEPSTLLLVGGFLGGLSLIRRRSSSK